MKLSSRFIGGLLGVIICSTVLYRSSHGAAAAAAAAAESLRLRTPAAAAAAQLAMGSDVSRTGDPGLNLVADRIYYRDEPHSSSSGIKLLGAPDVTLKQVLSFTESDKSGIFVFKDAYGMGLPTSRTYLYLEIEIFDEKTGAKKGTGYKRVEAYSEEAFCAYFGGRFMRFPFRSDLQLRYERFLRYTGHPLAGKGLPMTPKERAAYTNPETQNWIVIYDPVGETCVEVKPGKFEPYDSAKHPAGTPAYYAPRHFEWMDAKAFKSKSWYYNYQAPVWGPGGLCTIQ